MKAHMFTGLIEEIGAVSDVQHTNDGSVIQIHASAILEGIDLGDSIAIDGACTTVVNFDNRGFTIQASLETMRKTTFGTYQAATRVNLERPLTPESRIGGHYVTGHVDGTAKLSRSMSEGNAILLDFTMDDPELAQYLVPKGSVAINGISLTVNSVHEKTFAVAIIPHTWEHTTLSDRKLGDAVNIETDLLGKYVYRFLQPTEIKAAPVRQTLDEAFLAAHGFIAV